MSTLSHKEPGPDGLSPDFSGTTFGPLDRLLGFWFKPAADLTTLAAIRICTGLLFTYILIVYALNLQGYVGKSAWVDEEMMNKLRYEQPMRLMASDWNDSDLNLSPDEQTEERASQFFRDWEVPKRRMYAFGMPTWSIWYHVTDPFWMVVVHWSIILVSILFTLGFCTRVTSVIAWVAYVSYVNRAVTSYFGMDTMMNLLLIYLMIGGVLGATAGALSLDRWLVRWWNRRAGLGAKSDPGPSLLARVGGNFTLRLIQINFCIIYMASGLSKLQGSAWWNGLAMWGVSANPELNPLDFGPYLSFLTFLCQHRMLWEIAMHAGVLFTLVLEIGFPFLIWLPKWRWIMIIGAVMMHTGIALQMSLVGFSLSMLTLLLAFVPPETVRRMANLIMDQFRPLVEARRPYRAAA
jgi:uncharacterized membrane protein YphA (DoxX/SURF4 family)